MERIEDERWNELRQRQEFLVKWSAWPAAEAIWEPRENLTVIASPRLGLSTHCRPFRTAASYSTSSRGPVPAGKLWLVPLLVTLHASFFLDRQWTPWSKLLRRWQSGTRPKTHPGRHILRCHRASLQNVCCLEMSYSPAVCSEPQ